jgi:hypothetical protein
VPRGCPAPPLKHQRALPARIYQALATACNACPLKTQCTTSRRGRRVRRSVDEAHFALVRSYHATDAYAKAMRKRKVWVEPLFAEAKDWHGLRRLRLRGLGNVNIEGLLVAAGQNLKRLLSRWGWGRRPWPNGAAGLVCPPHRRCRWPAVDPCRRTSPGPHSAERAPVTLFQHAGALSREGNKRSPVSPNGNTGQARMRGG